MLIPSTAELLRVYWGLEFAVPFILISILFFIWLFYEVGYLVGKKETLRYVWEKGVPHSQKQYDNTYKKWKNKIRG